ncbi:helix-turn-helix domain-containing protein [Nocardiopsis sediminis]|uniref:Helix-turn-helix domain-containing protein n=1 Tax=Nocardiopsis sediminis TaxID=1778267 RepID=A0ABV8FVE3_9ACTN
MPTLSGMCDEPDFCLRFAINGDQHGDRAVDSVRVLPGRAWKGDHPGDVRDALVVIGRPEPAGHQDLRAAADRLLRELARQRAAGLAVVTDRHGARTVPLPVRNSAARLNVPLLTTTATPDAWATALIPRLRDYRFRQAEWHADQLTALFNRLPDRLGDAGEAATQRIADWLAAAVDAEVMVSDPERGVLAASPETAPGTLAPLLVTQSVRPESSDPPGPAAGGAPHTRLIPLAPTRTAAVLSVAGRRPFNEVDTDLIRHAAKVLGLIDQAEHRHRIAGAEREVHLSTFQLLLLGEEIAAQRVMAAIAPGLLATDHVRVYVIDCADEDREMTARDAEHAVADRALLALCPAFNHLLVVDPLHEGDTDDPGRVRDALRRVVAARPLHRMGGSRMRPLGGVADAYNEAINALPLAQRLPDRVALSDERANLVDVLPVEPARRWAGAVLRPLLTLPTDRSDRLLGTLDLGLDFTQKAAGRILSIHRNTVTHRITTCFDLLGIDRDRVLNQVAVSAALKIIGVHGHDDAATDPAADFAAMLSAPEVRAWAEAFLAPLRDDPRDLLGTLGAWLDNDTHAERTAAALGTSPAVVRGHLRAAAPLIRRELVPDVESDDALDDEHVLGGVRPLAFALRVGVGRPHIPDAWPRAARG